MARRIPPGQRQTLANRSLFVFPSRWGGIFVSMVMIMLITGINYQNALIQGLAFLLIAVFIIHIIQTYRNLAGLTLSFLRSEPVFPKQMMQLVIGVDSGSRQRQGIALGWPPETYKRFDLKASEFREIELSLPATRRGRYRPGRLLVLSSWPLGLITVWSWVDLNVEAWVYPARLPAPAREMDTGTDGDPENDHGRAIKGSEGDFAGLRMYKEGEPLRRIAWKKYAQTGIKLVRELEHNQAAPEWVDFDSYRHLPLEERLSAMADALCVLCESGAPAGLRMPGLVLDPGEGHEHLKNCLLALARYGES